MTADLVIDYDVHLRSGRVWRVEVEVPLSDNVEELPEDAPTTLYVAVDVVAPNRDLAQYIAATMYPTYTSLCIDDEPLSPNDTRFQTQST